MIVVVAVLAVGFVVKGFFQSPKAKVTKALVSTIDQLEEETSEVNESLPVFEYFKDFYEEEYSFQSHQTDIGCDVEILCDYKNKSIKGIVDLMGLEINAQISDKYITLDNDMLDDVYGIQVDSLVEDLQKAGYLSSEYEDMASDLELKLFNRPGDAIKEIQEIIKTELIASFKDLQVEEIDSEKIEVDGKTKKVDTYRIYLSREDFEKFTVNMIDNMFSNEVIIEKFMLNEEELEDYKTQVKEDIVEFIFENDAPAKLTTIVSVENGKVVQIIDGQGEKEITMNFRNTKNLLQEVDIKTVDNELSFKTKLDDKHFELEYLNPNGGSMSLVYEFDKKEDNVKVNDGYSDYIFTLDSTEKDKLRFAYEGLEVESEKNNLPKDWFQQDSEFINILELSPEELQGILLQAYGM